MMQFYIKSKSYTRDELFGYLQPYFDSASDVSMFIDSLLQTRQIEKKGEIFYFPATHERRLTRPRYFRFELISGGGGDRVSIRGSRGFTERVGFPSEIYVYKYIKRNTWLPIPERPSLRLSKGRLPSSIESWRGQIPTPISRKYGLKVGDFVAVRIDSVTIEYFCLLQLWGYEHSETLTFQYDKNPVNARHLELRGTEFVSETRGNNISEQTSRTSEQIQGIMDSLLFSSDREYYEAAHHPKFETIVGSELTPLKERTSKNPIVQFEDLDRQTALLEWSTIRTFDRIPEQTDFILKRTAIKQRRVPGTEWW